MAGFDPDAYLAKQKAFDPDAYLASMPAAVPAAPTTPDAIPAPRGGLKAGFAGLADTVLGIVPQAIAETGYAGVRALESVGLAEPGRAARGKAAFMDKFGRPIGDATGLSGTQEYQNEASQQAMAAVADFIGDKADWVSQKTGIPKGDIENSVFWISLLGPKIAGKAKRVGGKVVEATAPVVRSAAATVAETPAAQAVIKPLQERKAAKQAAAVQKSVETAAQIEAAQRAVDLGIALNPAVSNPTKMNRAKATIAGTTNLNENLSKINEVQITNLVRQDMGLPNTTVLTPKAFELALDQHSGPYNAVREIPQLVPDEGAMQKIASLRIDRPVIGGEANAAAVNALVDEALQKVAEGRSGAEIITDIRKLRKDANAIYSAQQKGGVPDPATIARAEANMGVADALESLIEANVTDPKLLGELRNARAQMAKIYAYERATNFATNRIDAGVLAKMVEEGKPLSGVAADIGKIAAVYPEVVQSGKAGVPAWAPERLTRSGAAGTIGYAVGATVGAPLLGAVVGAGTGNILSGMSGRRIATPAYQRANALPPDFRPPVNNLRPAPPSTTPNLPVPYDYRNALIPPEQIPNWVFGQTIPEADVQVRAPSAPQLGAPSPESTQAFVNQQRAYEYNRAKAEAEAAAAQQAATEAAARVPTSGEVVLELDPVTGKLRSTSQGLKGATPETMRTTGRALESAAAKVSSGQKFALSAEEKIAWDKTKVDLASVDAEFSKLSDKALAEKALDRAWVAETVEKAKQKAAAFEEIAKRSKDAQEVLRAKAERERLMDVLEALEPKLSKARPVRSEAQGPKTREAIRNRLAPQNQNNLRND